jgi:hypothetical protein
MIINNNQTIMLPEQKHFGENCDYGFFCELEPTTTVSYLQKTTRTFKPYKCNSQLSKIIEEDEYVECKETIETILSNTNPTSLWKRRLYFLAVVYTTAFVVISAQFVLYYAWSK